MDLPRWLVVLTARGHREIARNFEAYPMIIQPGLLGNGKFNNLFMKDKFGSTVKEQDSGGYF